MGADVVIVATGSLPDGKAFQRAMPEMMRCPASNAQMWPVRGRDGADRQARKARRGAGRARRTGVWAAGVALTLDEAGYDVTMVTGACLRDVREMARTNADIQLRSRLARAGRAHDDGDDPARMATGDGADG